MLPKVPLFSRSIPVTASEKQKSHADEKESKSPRTAENEDDNNYKCARLSLVKNMDDDESGEEQISSALFVPHHTPHESPERDHHGLDSVARPRLNDQRRDTSSSQQWLEEHKVPSREFDKKYLSQEAKSRPLPSPAHLKQQTAQVEKEISLPIPRSLQSDKEMEDDGDTIAGGSSWLIPWIQAPPGSQKGHQIPADYSQHVHDHQYDSTQPLQAIELIPYRHQVGGHTAMWRFSKRAVCKQLNNRENEFYETVERYHPELLKFLPRYV